MTDSEANSTNRSTQLTDTELNTVLTEARTELDRQQRELNKVTNKAVRNIQFGTVVLTLLLGIAKFGSGDSIEITSVMVLAGLGLASSIILSIIAIRLSSAIGESQLEWVSPPLSDRNDADSSASHGDCSLDNWKRQRLENYTQRICNYTNRRQKAGAITVYGMILGFSSGIGLLVAVVNEVNKIQRFNIPGLEAPLEPLHVLLIAALISIVLIYSTRYSSRS